MNGEDSITCDWTEWRRHVLLEIKRLTTNMERVDERHREISADISGLKVHAAMWGAVGGLIVSLLLTKLILGD